MLAEAAGRVVRCPDAIANGSTLPPMSLPDALFLELPDEFLEFLDRVARSGGVRPQVVLREALDLLRRDESDPESWRQARGLSPEFERAVLAAWERWSEGKHLTVVPVASDLSQFAAAKTATGDFQDATALAMLALLRYAREHELLPTDED